MTYGNIAYVMGTRFTHYRTAYITGPKKGTPRNNVLFGRPVFPNGYRPSCILYSQRNLPLQVPEAILDMHPSWPANANSPPSQGFYGLAFLLRRHESFKVGSEIYFPVGDPQLATYVCPMFVHRGCRDVFQFTNLFV